MSRLWARKNAIGLKILVTVKEDDVAVNISGVTTKNIVITKPDGTTVLTCAASFTTDGTDGKIQYVTVADDLDQPGTYLIQADLAFIGGGYDGPTDIGELWVY
jgi:hypothetical protein